MTSEVGAASAWPGHEQIQPQAPGEVPRRRRALRAVSLCVRVLVDVVGGSSPYLLLIGLFVVAAAFSVAVSNTATALILIPVALSAAAELDVAVQPVLMSVAVACAASFLTPISTPGNLMVMEPGGYRFGDYWRFGVPFVGLFFVVAVFLVPLVWSF